MSHSLAFQVNKICVQNTNKGQILGTETHVSAATLNQQTFDQLTLTLPDLGEIENNVAVYLPGYICFPAMAKFKCDSCRNIWQADQDEQTSLVAKFVFFNHAKYTGEQSTLSTKRINVACNGADGASLSWVMHRTNQVMLRGSLLLLQMEGFILRMWCALRNDQQQ